MDMWGMRPCASVYCPTNSSGKMSASTVQEQFGEKERKQVFLACIEDCLFCRCHKAWGTPCDLKNSWWLENVEVVTVQRILCLEKPKVYWNNKESNGPRRQWVWFPIFVQDWEHSEVWGTHYVPNTWCAAEFHRGFKLESCLQWTYKDGICTRWVRGVL